jgi:hypothetical protein
MEPVKDYKDENASMSVKLIDCDFHGPFPVRFENGKPVELVMEDWVCYPKTTHSGLVEALKYARDWLANQDGNAMLLSMNNPEVKAAFTKIDEALAKAGVK